MTDLRDTNSEEIQALRHDRKPRVVSGMNRPYEPKPLGEQSKALRRQAIMVIIGNLSVMSTGLGLGLPTITKASLTDINAKVYLTESEFSWFASLNLFSAPLGGLLSGLLLDSLGRKRTMFAMNLTGLTSWILMALASGENTQSMFIQLMISRFIMGIASGLASAPVGVYSAEISTPKIRGRLILGTSLSVATGITIIYFMGYFIRNDWHLIAYICTGFQIVALLLIFVLPESPYWLISKSRLSEAKMSLNFFRGLDKKPVITHPEVLAEFNVLQKNIQLAGDQEKESFLKSLKSPEVYKPILILSGMFTFQNVTGIFIIIVYAVQISEEAGVTIDPFMCAIMIGLARVLSTIPLAFFYEKWGRRLSGIISALGMTVCMMLLAFNKVPVICDIPNLAVISIISFIVLSTLGLFTLPFFMISEVFPQRVRGPSSGLTVAFGTLVAFICIKTYPSLKNAIGNDNCFIIFGVASLLGAIFIYFCLPETRGRTLMEIEEEFKTGKRGNRPYLVEPVEMQEINVK